MRRLTHLLILAAFIFSCGGQWYVLQGVAWIKMIHDFSEDVPLAQAVSMTLSGEYPCAMCKEIAQKKQADKDRLCEIEKFAKVFPPASVAACPPREFYGARQARRTLSLVFRSEPPPIPPPRFPLAS